MKKFPKIPSIEKEDAELVLGAPVVATEKLDGANFRWTVTDKNELLCGSRNVIFSEGDEPLPFNEINHNFRHAVNYVEGLFSLPEYVGGSVVTKLTFFGEALHKHELMYDDIDYVQPGKGAPNPGGSHPNVVLYDVYHEDKGWLPWETVTKYAEAMEIPLAEELFIGTVESEKAARELVPDESVYGGPPEGIVIRAQNGSSRAKIVTDRFRETKKNTTSGSVERSSEARSFVQKFCTPARIGKQAHALRDEGGYESFSMEMMQDLPKEVLKDVLAEEGWPLMCHENELELTEGSKKEIRQQTSSRCSRVLQSLIE